MPIKTNTEALKSTAGRVRSKNLDLTGKLSEIRTVMNNTEPDFQSESGKTIRQNMNALESRFGQYKDVVESYCKFLEQTAESYEIMEIALKSNAEKFSNL